MREAKGTAAGSPSLWILNQAPWKLEEAPSFELRVELHPRRPWQA